MFRWSDGLHQAVEAKEGLEIQAESITLASVSYQAFFRWGERHGGEGAETRGGGVGGGEMGGGVQGRQGRGLGYVRQQWPLSIRRRGRGGRLQGRYHGCVPWGIAGEGG